MNLLSHIILPDNLIEYDYSYYFLPVVSTSAKLWVTDTNIAEAEISTGNLLILDEAREVSFVWFNYNRPREL